MFRNGLAQVVLRGNLVAQPESAVTASGTERAKMRVAVNRTWRDKNGEQQEQVSFIPVTVWGKLAEACTSNLQKGQEVEIVGELRQERFEGDNGENVSYIHVIASRVDFGSRPKGTEQRPQEEDDFDF